MSLPAHVAIIMDGNGRWAKAQGKPRSYGHYRGTQVVKDIAIAASDMGIQYLTLYAFSTENWIRPKEEVKYLMGLPGMFYDQYIDILMAHHIKATMIGEFDPLPEATKKVLIRLFERTKDNDGMRLIFAFNYGSRREIQLAVQHIISEGIPAKDISDKTISDHLFTKDIPDVDLLIRTSGEERLSNFLLWQLAYAEFVFTKTDWPDMTPELFAELIKEYEGRHRRFGGVEK